MMDDVKSAANALNDRGLQFEVSVGEVDDLENGFESPNVRDNLMGSKMGHSDPSKEAPRPLGICGCLTLAYYQPYFNVDTEDVQQRLLRALIPFKKDPGFAELALAVPDAYGPVWLSTTLIFSLASCSNLASYLDSYGDNNEWTYDFSRVATACTLVQMFLVGVPAFFWAVAKYSNIPLSFSFLLCLYGYSSTIFIPATASLFLLLR